MATKITMPDDRNLVRFDELNQGEWFLYGGQLRRKVTKDTYHIVCIYNTNCQTNPGAMDTPVQPVDVEIIVRPKGA